MVDAAPPVLIVHPTYPGDRAISPTPPSDPPADAALVRASLSGDEGAFRALVERYGEVTHKRMGHFARDAATREELAHEVFVQAFLGLATYRGDAPFEHWLARVATRVGYAHWRKRAANREVSLDGMEERVASPPAPLDDAPAAQPSDAADLLYELFAQLPPDDRLVLTLAYRERCSQAEIAKRLGCGRVRVAVRLHRARHKLRALGDREPWKGRLAWILS